VTLPTIADVLRRERRSALAGRELELSQLGQIRMPGGPLVAYVHGSAGIGKTSLLAASAAELADEGIQIVRIHTKDVEPSPADLGAALAKMFGSGSPTFDGLLAALSPQERIRVVVIDDVDEWHTDLTWLRAELLPSLPANLRFILASAAPPSAAWSTEYGRHFLEIKLGCLTREQSDAAVAAASLPGRVANRIWTLTGGHPLGLQMAIHACRNGSLDTVRDAGELANTILHAIGDSELRRAVEACAIVRRANRELVASILETGSAVPLALLEAVEALPFATRDSEGIFVVEPVRQAIVDWMSGVDAERYRAWRRIAAEWFAVRLRATRGAARWRYLADLLHLLEEPLLRTAFSACDVAAPTVEPALPGDFAEIFDIAETRNGIDDRRRLEAWAQCVPHRFSVARGVDDEVVAFSLFARGSDAHAGLESADPLFAGWKRHLIDNPVEAEVLFIREVSARAPDAHVAARAACILDLKRNYLECNSLARIYCHSSENDAHLLHRLGFRPRKQAQIDLPATMVLDVPGADIIEWICVLAGGRPKISNEDQLAFARDRREIIVDEQVIELTPLEAKVLSELIDHAPAVVRREDLIERVWSRTVVGSNVVDTVIRTLRSKMASMRDCVQTVPKAGYRYVSRDRSLGR
jgi:hypothetical protein